MAPEAPTVEEEGHQTTLAALYHFLTRLTRKGVVESYKVFMSNKRAWRLKKECKLLITRALRAQT
ncbi:MAG: hypothetical protein F7C35_05700 [Desulfurococcales archaeon]|nr:hypothetical protein [Desulfurococcales archaeon]